MWVLQCVVGCCRVLQCAAMCCSMLQCVACNTSIMSIDVLHHPLGHI